MDSTNAQPTLPVDMPADERKRILVTGSREWPIQYRTVIAQALLDWWLAAGRPQGAILVSGHARGADQFAEENWNGNKFPIEIHEADWDQYGKRAGYERNKEMVEAGADVCLAFIYNDSKGATMCLELAQTAGIPCVVYRINTPEKADTP